MARFTSLSRRHFLTAVAGAAGSTLLPKGLMAGPLQDPVLNAIQNDAKALKREKVPWKALPFPLKQVRLGDGPCKAAMEADRRISAFAAARSPLTHFPDHRRNFDPSPAAGRMGDARLRTSRPLRRRALSFRVRTHVRRVRR